MADSKAAEAQPQPASPEKSKAELVKGIVSALENISGFNGGGLRSIYALQELTNVVKPLMQEAAESSHFESFEDVRNDPSVSKAFEGIQAHFESCVRDEESNLLTLQREWFN